MTEKLFFSLLITKVRVNLGASSDFSCAGESRCSLGEEPLFADPVADEVLLPVSGRKGLPFIDILASDKSNGFFRGGGSGREASFREAFLTAAFGFRPLFFGSFFPFACFFSERGPTLDNGVSDSRSGPFLF